MSLTLDARQGYSPILMAKHPVVTFLTSKLCLVPMWSRSVVKPIPSHLRN
jgi:hypothetical protein